MPVFSGFLEPTSQALLQPSDQQLHGFITHESQLLGSTGDVAGDDVQNAHEQKNAPLLTRGAYRIEKIRQAISQYGVFGTIVESRYDNSHHIKVLLLPDAVKNVLSRLPLAQSHAAATAPVEDSRRLYLNTNTPFSALVCGVQGSGKSHTLSVILENMFVTGCKALGELVKPLSGLVLHVGETGACAAPCEAAYVSLSVIENASPPPVRVYVAPSSFKRMKTVYGHLNKCEVKPLYFSESELDAPAFLSLMAVNTSDNTPLYMHTVLSVLRELGDDYTYSAFMTKLDECKKAMNPGQKAGLKQRLELLQTFTRTTDKPTLSRMSRNTMALKNEERFAAGMVTIVDLSDPFVDPALAGAIFEICVRLFQKASVDTGKVLVVDEAHKYLSETNTSNVLTQALLSLVRQQRHMSMRVIVSTQEPTVLPAAFLALCSTIILHRFQSPAWWEHLKKHISANLSSDDAFDRVVTLKTGEALVCCPTGLYVESDTSASSQGPKARLMQFSRNFIVVRTRKRITADGGVSIMAV